MMCKALLLTAVAGLLLVSASGSVLKEIEQGLQLHGKEKEYIRPVLASLFLAEKHDSVEEVIELLDTASNLPDDEDSEDETDDEILPEPGTPIEQFSLKTLNHGEIDVKPGAEASYLLAVLYPNDGRSYFWFNASLPKLFDTLPPKAHLLFAVAGEGMEDMLIEMQERCQATEGYDQVESRLHFIESPLNVGCGLSDFPKCPKDEEQPDGLSDITQALSSWGTLQPKITGKLPSSTQEIKAKVAKDWTISISDAVGGQAGSAEFELAVWGGQACDPKTDGPKMDPAGKIVVIDRGTCSFYQKVKHAADKGAKAVLVRNPSSTTTLGSMGCGAPDPCASSKLGIPAALVNFADIAPLVSEAEQGETVTITLSNQIDHVDLVGLDHNSSIREIGRIDHSGDDADNAWWYAALETVYYDYEEKLDSQLSDPEHFKMTVFDGDIQDGTAQAPYLGGGSGIYANFEMPEESWMFGSVQVFVKLECVGSSDKSCGPWDYVVQLNLCTVPEVTPAQPPFGKVDGSGGSHASCNFEIGRFVTAYGRPGKWIVDGTAGLSHLRWGGRQQMVLSQPAWSAQKYKATVELLFQTPKDKIVPLKSTPLFPGGKFDERYNYIASHKPKAFDVSPSTSRLEIHSIITGHGWGTDSEDCAEFCVTQHKFTVMAALELDGDVYVSKESESFQKDLQGAGSDTGCAGKVSSGIMPNQHGTWKYGRAGWCPGGVAEKWIVDVSKHLHGGMKAVVSYEGLFDGKDYHPKPCQGDQCSSNGFNATINMKSYLVEYGMASDPQQKIFT